jgi:hypothetical protein
VLAGTGGVALPQSFIGSRGRGGFSGMLLGSTNQALMYHVPCPLLVVRPVATP